MYHNTATDVREIISIYQTYLATAGMFSVILTLLQCAVLEKTHRDIVLVWKL